MATTSIQVGAASAVGRDINVPLRMEFDEHYDLMKEDECLSAQKKWIPKGQLEDQIKRTHSIWVHTTPIQTFCKTFTRTNSLSYVSYEFIQIIAVDK